MKYMEMQIDISKEKLACFIHSTTLDLWKDTFLIEILDRMQSSGLLARMDHVCIVNTGQPIDTVSFETKYAPAKVVHYTENTMEFENVTIRLLSVFAKLHPEYKILYMHTKGISYGKDHVFYKGVKAWNHFMMYCLVDQYEKCLPILNVYDTVGTNYRPLEHGNGQHYSGNFWWATANYIQHLPIQYLKDKYHPEFWLLQNNPLFFNIHTIEHMYEQAYPEENYRESVQSGFEHNVIFCKVGFPYTGLCNQLFNIVNSLVIAAVQSGNKVVILDDFIKDIHTLETISANEVLDMEKTNLELKPYNISVIYKKDVKMTLDKVEYGLKDVQVMDITKSVRDRFYVENRLYIPQWTGMNDVAGSDPCPQMRKQIYVYYSLNGIPFMKTFHERKLIFNEPIEINHLNYDQKSCRHVLDLTSPWLTRISRDDAKEMKPFFDKFLNLLHYQEMYSKEANSFLQMIHFDDRKTKNEKINVFHVRNELDAMTHWSKINNMTEDQYRIAYEMKFLNMVRKNTNKEDVNIILTSLVENNNIIGTLKEEGYNVYVRPNIENIGREMNGVVDLLLGKFCTNCLIGNFYFSAEKKTFGGSTFSFALYNQLEPDTNIQHVFINMDNIRES